MALYATDMTRFARSCVTAGNVLVWQHRPDEVTGCCVECHRPSPCDRRREGWWLINRYSRWLAEHPDNEPDTTTTVSPVRPYVGELAPVIANHGHWRPGPAR